MIVKNDYNEGQQYIGRLSPNEVSTLDHNLAPTPTAAQPQPARTSGRSFWAHWRTSLHALAYLAALIVAAPRWPYLWAGLPFIILGLALRTWALGYLTKDEVLCTSGPYAYTRNPLYLGSFFILIGLFIAANSFYLTVAALVLAVLVYTFTVRAEESFLSKRFGEDYAHYRACVPRLFPYRRSYAQADPALSFSWPRAVGNNAAELAGWVMLLFAVFLVKALVGPHLGLWPYSGLGPPLTYGIWWPGFSG